MNNLNLKLGYLQYFVFVLEQQVLPTKLRTAQNAFLQN